MQERRRRPVGLQPKARGSRREAVNRRTIAQTARLVFKVMVMVRVRVDVIRVRFLRVSYFQGVFCVNFIQSPGVGLCVVPLSPSPLL